MVKGPVTAYTDNGRRVHNDGLPQASNNSNVNTQELLRFCTATDIMEWVTAAKKPKENAKLYTYIQI